MLDAATLLAEGAPLRTEFEGWLGRVDAKKPQVTSFDRDLVTSRGTADLDRVVFQRIVMLRPQKRVLAGADFKRPIAPGIGQCEYLAIWVTADSNEALRNDVASGRGINGEVVTANSDGVEVFHSKVELFAEATAPPGQQNDARSMQVSVAFPTPHVTVVSFVPNGAAHVAKALKQKAERNVPLRWQSLASRIDLNAPLVLLRRMGNPQQCVGYPDPNNRSKPIIRDITLHGFAIAAAPDEPLRFRLVADAPSAEDAYLYFQGGGTRGGFPAPTYTWDRINRVGGFDATVTFTPTPTARNSHASLLMIGFFGLEILI
ncbi:MAG: hypothetical protein SF069_16115 [Phycisphaerae bacterium]|nr:hypothetical protein [Phycisphaerae bacterium]